MLWWGTLASGLLPICFGEATKFAQSLLDADKAYLATLRFGITTTTGDRDGEVLATRPVQLEQRDLEAVLPRFAGRIEQVPPRHAALRHQGRRYYEYARRGIEIPRAPRAVEIRELTLCSWRAPQLALFVRCSKGTYIRALAEDIGIAVQCGAHLEALRRVATGGFALDDALTLEALEAMSETERDAALRPAEMLVAQLPRLDLEGLEAYRFVQGQALARAALADGLVRVYADGCFAGIAELAEGVLRARRLVSVQPASRAIETVES